MYDELLIFNMKNLDKETFADGLIRIACYDVNSIPMAGALLCFLAPYLVQCYLSPVALNRREMIKFAIFFSFLCCVEIFR